MSYMTHINIYDMKVEVKLPREMKGTDRRKKEENRV